MKKTLTILALVAGAASYVQAQGTIVFYNTSSTFAVSTNATSIGGGVGPTALTANSFYYALLDSSTALADNPLAAGWSSAVLTGVNVSSPPIASFAGGINGQGGAGGGGATGFSTPANGSYTSGSLEYYIIVGWSSNLGTTWAQASANLATATSGFYGYSGVGDAFGGGGPSSLPAVNLFGVSQGAPGGLTSGFDLNAIVPTPEPTTIALGVMGAASLLALRRKKA